MKPNNQSGPDSQKKELRLWPGILILVLQLAIRFLLPLIDPNMMMNAIFGGLIGGVLIAVWWLFLSRDSWINRWGAVLLIIASLYITSLFLDESIARANMGLAFIIHSIPVMSVALDRKSVV